MGRREREVSLSTAERLADGLPIGVRLRVGIELLRSVADGPPAQAAPRSAESRLLFERVTIGRSSSVCAKGAGDSSGAALVLWEILAGRPLGEEPLRLHDIVDDMPADVDDLVMDAVRSGAPATTAAELFDALAGVAEPYAVTLDALWDLLPSGEPPPSKGAASSRPASAPASAPAPRSRRSGAPASKRAGPRSTRGSAPDATEASAASTRSASAPAEAPSPPPSPSLLLIHAGEESRSLADALRGAGYAVVVCGDAASGLAYAIAENPICILCDSELPDADGEAVVRSLRRQPSAVADAPFLLLTSHAETRGRVSRFGAGADVCVLKPVKTALLVQQINALVDMSSRLRAAHHAVPALPRVSEALAVTGDIRQVGIAAMLTILEMERRTGSFVATGWGERATSARDRFELELARGCVAGASAMGVPAGPIEVVRAMMRLEVGRFSFKPTKARSVDDGGRAKPSLRELLSEAARLEDEAAGRS